MPKRLLKADGGDVDHRIAGKSPVDIGRVAAADDAAVLDADPSILLK
jgi:hypothetical protein